MAASFLAACLVGAATTALAAATLDCAGVNAVSPQCRSAETAYTRDIFMVGGRWIETSSGNITADQVYVEKLTPAGGAQHAAPLVFFHGGAVSGAQWLNTPDNRKGFASFFVDRGYAVYLLDHTGAGRSSQEDTTHYVLWNSTTVEGVASGFTAPEAAPAYPQATLHTQWPGSGAKGDAAFTAFSRQVIPFTKNWAHGEWSMRRSACELLALLGTPAYLVAHSSGAQYPVVVANDCPERVAGSINLDPSTQPFWSYGSGDLLATGSATRAWGLANTPLAYDPPVADPAALNKTWVGNDTRARRACYLQAEPAAQLPNIARVPYLALTGEASVHATYDHCVIDYLRQAGGDPEWIQLKDRNITGNGHFSMMELNNLDIAAVVHEWIQQKEANSSSSSTSASTTTTTTTTDDDQQDSTR